MIPKISDTAQPTEEEVKEYENMMSKCREFPYVDFVWFASGLCVNLTMFM